MSDERPAGEPGAEEVGADTGKFRAFVRQGEQLDGRERSGRGVRVAALLAGLVVLAAVVALLLR